jgi:hypothetical protein
MFSVILVFCLRYPMPSLMIAVLLTVSLATGRFLRRVSRQPSVQRVSPDVMLESEDCLLERCYAIDESDESFDAFNAFHGFLLFDQRERVLRKRQQTIMPLSSDLCESNLRFALLWLLSLASSTTKRREKRNVAGGFRSKGTTLVA